LMCGRARLPDNLKGLAGRNDGSWANGMQHLKAAEPGVVKDALSRERIGPADFRRFRTLPGVMRTARLKSGAGKYIRKYVLGAPRPAAATLWRGPVQYCGTPRD
ncbi:MAG: hypothetical protein WAM44_16675, partial [Chthoniobacterales bacterium]